MPRRRRKGGYGAEFIHRTGHSLGETVHGNGVHLDDYETHDDRRLIPGTGFTIEPGVYTSRFGVRTEINMFMDESDAYVSGPRQEQILPLACLGSKQLLLETTEMSTRKTTVFYGVLIAIASIAVGMVIASQWGLPQASSAQSVNVPAANTAALNGPIDAQTFRNIAKAQSPTVVNVRTTARGRGRELTEFFGGQDDLLQRFFGQGQGQQGRRRPAPDREVPPQEGSGTGFIIDKSGFILTNNHVVDGADDIRVSLFGGGRTESYAAKVIGRDSLTDTALIQLTEMPAAPLQEAKFGDSAQMQPGDWVMAIGNPFNLSHTVTVGVISALGRPLGGMPGREQPMLQTDAAINPGTRAVRSSMSAARSSASTRRSIRTRSGRPTSGSASRRRSTRSATCCRSCATAR